MFKLGKSAFAREVKIDVVSAEIYYLFTIWEYLKVEV
jgi:hypothetical protein